MWFAWFSFGVFTGLFTAILIDYFCDVQDWMKYIPKFNGFGGFQTSLRSHNTASSAAERSSPSGGFQTSLRSHNTASFAAERSSPSGWFHNTASSAAKRSSTSGWFHNTFSSAAERSSPSGWFQNVQNPINRVSSRGSISNSSDSSQTSLISSNTEEIPSSHDWLQIPNVLFYQNKIPAIPNEECIEEILTYWVGNYVILQENPSYIQWLFPNRIPGNNPDAHVLTDEEAKIIRETPELRNRLKRAFEMMLDLYGMTLTTNNQIQLRQNSNKRLKQLNKKDSHNFLYITRILLALKELGHNNLMLPWLICLADLIYKKNKLNHAKFSFENYWINTLDAEEKIQLTILMGS